MQLRQPERAKRQAVAMSSGPTAGVPEEAAEAITAQMMTRVVFLTELFS